MPAVNLSPLFNAAQLLTDSGLPLSGGLINTYAAGTSTPLATYTTSAGTVTNANPIPTLSTGRLANEVWLISGSSYKFVVTDSLLNVLGTYDNITGNLAAGGPIAGVTDLTTTGNTILGDATADTLNVGNGGIVKDASGNTTFGGNATISGGGGLTTTKVTSSGAITATTVAGTGAITGSSGPGVLIGPPITTGSSTAYVLTPTIASTTYTQGAWLVRFHVASGTSPTLNISGLGAKSLKQYSGLTKVAASFPIDTTLMVAYDGTDLVMDTAPSLAQSLSANGYQTLPGGIIMQWGTLAVAYGTTQIFTFPIPFPANLFSVQVTVKNNTQTQIEVDITPTAQSLTSVSIENQYVGDSSGSTTSLTAQILAIGN